MLDTAYMDLKLIAVVYHSFVYDIVMNQKPFDVYALAFCSKDEVSTELMLIGRN